MKKRVSNNDKKENTASSNTEIKGKKPYCRPRFIVYGDLSQITKGVGGTKGEGPTQPKSRVG
jgi:hypothetical protein